MKRIDHALQRMCPISFCFNVNQNIAPVNPDNSGSHQIVRFARLLCGSVEKFQDRNDSLPFLIID